VRLFIKSSINSRAWQLLLILSPVVLYIAFSIYFFISQDNLFHEPRRAQLGMQVMDLEWIKENFWQCLLYNHYQPPLMSNIFNGLIYIFAPSLLYPAFFAVNYILSWTAFIAFVWILHKVRVHAIWIFVIGMLIALYPFRWMNETMMMYVTQSYALSLLVLFFLVRFIYSPRVRTFALLSLMVFLLTILNSFFHFVWGIVIVVAACLLAGQWRRWILPCMIAVVLIMAWPVKNWVVFGNLSSSSCSGIVLAQRVGPNPYLLHKHIQDGEVSKLAWTIRHPYDPKIYTEPRIHLPERFKGIRCLTEPWKGKYTPEEYGNFQTFNFNYYKVMTMTKVLAKYSIWYAKEHPRTYIYITFAQFLNLFSGDNSRLDPCFGFFKKFHFQSAHGMSVRGLLYVLSVLGGLFYLARHWKKRREASYRILVFVMLNLMYSLALGILIAYFDGPRYRFYFEFYYLFMLAWCLNAVFPIRAKAPSK